MNKEELKEFIILRKELVQKQEMLFELRSKLSIASPLINDDIKGKGPVKSNVCEQAVRIVDLENEIAKSIEKTYNKLIMIENVIDSLDGIERIVMRERYIFNKSWEKIADEQCYSWRNVHNIHSKALIKIKSIGTKECTQVHI